MKRAPFALASWSIVFALTACAGGGGHGGGGGGGGGGTPPVGVTVTTASGGTLEQPGGTEEITAAVTNATNANVVWSETGPACPAACGTLNNAAGNASINPVTYTAPSSVPAEFQVTITATSVQDGTKSASVTLTVPTTVCPSGHENLLLGTYAYLLSGAGPAGPLKIAGAFAADGLGGITGGVEDRTPIGATPPASLLSGSYSAGADGRGCLTLATTRGTTTYRFAVRLTTPASKGRIIEFDDKTGTGTRAEGTIALQHPAAFATGAISGHYVFGFRGADSSDKDVATAGVFSAAGGLIADGDIDSNDAGVVASASGVTGGYSVTDAVYGRGTAHLTIGPITATYVVYVVSATELMALAADPLDAQHPFVSGELVQQGSGSFDNASLSGHDVVWLSGFNPVQGAPVVSIGVLSPTGGPYSLLLDTNSGGTMTSAASFDGTYNVASNGRAATTISHGAAPILYLWNANTGYILGTDATVSFGQLEAQTAPLDGSSLGGYTFFFGTSGPRAASRMIASGAIAFNGTALTDTGHQDESTPGGLFPSVTFGPTMYNFPAGAPAPGRGTLNTAGGELAYLVTSTKLVYLHTVATKPRVVIVER